MDVDPAKTALVLIEYQNDFTTEGGALHDAVKGVMDRPDMLANTKRVADEARERRRDRHPRADHLRPGYGELGNPDKCTASSRASSTRNAFVKGTWGAAIVDEMAPQGERHRRRGQARPGRVRHHEPRLHPAQPRHRDRRAGRLPDQLLRRVDDAHRPTRRATTSSRSPTARAATQRRRAAAAIAQDYPMFSQPMTSTEAIGALHGAADVADASRSY